MPIPLHSWWSNSRSTGQVHRTGRPTVSLRRQGLDYPLHQLWKAQDRHCDELSPAPEAEWATTLFSLFHFFANRLFSVNAFDKLLLMASWSSMSILFNPGTHIPLENPPLRTGDCEPRVLVREACSLLPVAALFVPQSG